MNYRHAFHAGNFADVLKHIVLVRVLLHLREKETAFRVIDTHAGAGRYDLAGDEAQRTREWEGGIGRLLSQPVAGVAGELIAPYVVLVRSEQAGRALYPGSPRIALALARPQDRLVLCETLAEERAALTVAVGSDPRVRIADRDGWTMLKSELPPRERRGLVLIDPPFEEPDDFRRFETGLAEAYRRWATGIVLFWYPVKDALETDAFVRRIARIGIPKILRLELAIGPPRPDAALNACGLLILNPPWKLDSDAGRMLPALAAALGEAGPGRYRLEWVTP